MSEKLHLETARLIQRARHASGLSQAEFAKSIGKSQAVISRYEKGKVAPPGDVVMRCMHTLESHSSNTVGAPQTWDALLGALDKVTSVVRDLRTEALGRSR